MAEIKFSDNFNDISEQRGVNAGFQFEFFCERCNDTWRTEFTPYSGGRVSGWLGKASGLFGGIMGSVTDAAEGLAESGWGKAHDDSFRKSIEQAKHHFHRCAKCFQYVCDSCYNKDKGLCLNCAPDAQVEIEAAIAQGEVYAAGEKAALEGIQRGKKMDVKRSRQLVCPECGAETKGAKFCPECGHKLAEKHQCPGCSAEISPGTKFCPECGHKIDT